VHFSGLKVAVVGGLTAALAALAGCGGGTPTTSNSTAPTPSASGSAASPKPSASPTPSKAKVTPSTNLNAIKVDGAYGKEPKVTFKAPWAIDKTRTLVLQEGDGPTVQAKQSVTVNYYGVNGRTGKKFDDSFSRGQPVTFSLAQVVPGFSKGLTGQKQGSRVLIAMPGSDGYDASGGSAQAGIEVGDTLIFVVDIEATTLSGPEGAAVAPKAGLPTVKDNKGVPEVTVPKTDPPKTLVTQPLIKGSGAKVGAGDLITFDYAWYTWDGKLVESSYAGEPGSAELAKLLPGLRKGLVNQTVGSRVLLVVPPADGYPNGNASPKIDKNTTLVFVVDLLFTQAPQ
jgi:peptidylprolyl isomerase